MFIVIFFELCIMINDRTRFFCLILIQFVNNYYITKIKILQMITASKNSINSTNIHSSSKQSKQELIVEIKIGKKGETKCIRLCDIYNMNYVDQQINWFIKNNGLKDSAFSFIKQLILKQISQKREETYNQCHSKCSKNCKCQRKMNEYQQRQRQILDTISFSEHQIRRSSRSPSIHKKQPQHLQIKITPKIQNISTKARNERIEDISSFVFNSQFTLPSSISQKERVFLTDELFENVLETTQNKSSAFFSNMSEFKSKEREKQNKFTIKYKEFMIKKNDKNIRPLETSFKKNSTVTNNTPTRIKSKINIQQKQKALPTTPKPMNKCKIISTKQRKAALMTPQGSKTKQEIINSLIVLNSQNLETMVLQHKKNLKQTSLKLYQALTAETSINQNPPSPTIQSVLSSLFKKLTANNPPQMKQLHSQYVSYQLLEREELHFMGVLFEKIDHKELNNLNFTNFKASSLKYCWKQLEQLMISSQIRNTIETHKKTLLQ